MPPCLATCAANASHCAGSTAGYTPAALGSGLPTPEAAGKKTDRITEICRTVGGSEVLRTPKAAPTALGARLEYPRRRRRLPPPTTDHLKMSHQQLNVNSSLSDAMRNPKPLDTIAMQRRFRSRRVHDTCLFVSSHSTDPSAATSMDAAKPKGRKRATRKQDAAPAPTPAQAVADPEKLTALPESDAQPQQPRPSLSQRITRSLQQLGGASKAEEGDGWVEVEQLLQHPEPALAEPALEQACLRDNPLEEQHDDNGNLAPAEGEAATNCCGRMETAVSALARRFTALAACTLPKGGGSWAVPALLVCLVLLLTGGLWAAYQARSSRYQLAILQRQLSQELLASATAIGELHQQLGELSSAVGRLEAAQHASSGSIYEELQQACNAQAVTTADLAAEVTQLRQAVAAAEAAAAAATAQAQGHRHSVPPGESSELLKLIRREVSGALELFVADRTGLPDYALAATGAVVVAHSPVHLPRPGLFQRRLINVHRMSVHPEATKRLLAPFSQPGECLPLVGSSGYVDVRLTEPIRPSAVTYEHVPAAIQRSLNIGSAPRNLTLSGFLGMPPPHPSSPVEAQKRYADSGTAPPAEVHLASFSVNATGRHTVHTFPVELAAREVLIDHVRLSFSSNHGRREYTCLYRLRVHGTPQLVPVIIGRAIFGKAQKMSATLSSQRRAASPPPGSIDEQLWQSLFPGQGQYDAQTCAAKLASRLREAANSLEPQQHQQQQQQRQQQRIEPGKTKRCKVDRGKVGKGMDFGAYQQRYVALELLYLGHAYGGFARQDTTEETIEGHLFAALRTARMVPPGASWQEMRYSRGGRTDKGVSALGQVVALLLRSSGRVGEAVPEPEAEFDYPALLNRVLPNDIRVLGWADVDDEFSARFSAQYREYKYLIAYRPPQAPEAADTPMLEAGVAGNGAGKQGAAGAADAGAAAGGQAAGQAAPVGQALDVAAMQEAAAAFVGEHDFRHFCKADITAVTNHRRRILEFRVDAVPDCVLGERRLLQLHIRGTAFLWHQVRCMASVLLMVGRGEEQPSIVQTLLDLERTPRKPQYSRASEEPLLLYSCTYDGLRFRRTPQNYRAVQGVLEDALSSHLIRAGTIHSIQQRLAADPAHDAPGNTGNGNPVAAKAAAGTTQWATKHTPLMLRPMEPTMEERIAKLAAARQGQRERGSAGGEAAQPEAGVAVKA
ncbi:tRNA pseudouridine(38/39) synthase [Chlorella vulgaris]